MKGTGIAYILSLWFEKKARDLPWRSTRDPYKIWISEIILQQTRVSQGKDYYHRFIQQFPDIHSLATATSDEVMNQWKGLGYYSRARHLHETAQAVVLQHGGAFPNDYESLLTLKGIGEYTAAAIASMAFDVPVAVVDGNVYRVLARLYGIHDPVGSTSGMQKAREYAGQLLEKRSPGNHNQAMMEFGALQCTPTRPDCAGCPLSKQCYAFVNDMVDVLPTKKKKNQVRTRYFHYLVIMYRSSMFIRRREEKDIWKWLYEWPLVETSKAMKPQQLMLVPEFIHLMENTEYDLKTVSPEVHHMLSHQLIRSTFYHLHIRKLNPVLEQHYKRVEISRLDEYAFPALISQYLASILPSFSEHKD